MQRDNMPQAHALLSLYESNYHTKYGKKPVINRFRDKWGMLDIIETVGYSRGRELVNYYFRTQRPRHPLSFLFNNYDVLNTAYDQAEQDKIVRQNLLLETKRLVENDH